MDQHLILIKIEQSDINVYLKNGVHDSSDLYKIRDILIAHPGGSDSVTIYNE